MRDLPQHVRDAIKADVARRIAAAPPPSRKSVEAVKRLVRLFRLENNEDAA